MKNSPSDSAAGRPARFIEPELTVIPAGEVTLGAPACPAGYTLGHPWEGPRRVWVGGFQIGRFAVTRREYALFLSDSGRDKPLDWDDRVMDDPDQPVGGVCAEDADAYCAWLARLSGKPYRLPHVDEWEKAARGGLEGRIYPWGDEDPAGRAWYGRSEAEAPKPVGSFAPNGYGLYDMVGNVWQWLADLYVAIARDLPTQTTTGKSPLINRVLRGGSFMSGNPGCLWTAYKEEDPPDYRHRCMGFRLALAQT